MARIGRPRLLCRLACLPARCGRRSGGRPASGRRLRPGHPGRDAAGARTSSAADRRRRRSRCSKRNCRGSTATRPTSACSARPTPRTSRNCKLAQHDECARSTRSGCKSSTSRRSRKPPAERQAGRERDARGDDDPLQQTPRRGTTGRPIAPARRRKGLCRKALRRSRRLVRPGVWSRRRRSAARAAVGLLQAVLGRRPAQGRRGDRAPIPAAELEREVTTALRTGRRRSEARHLRPAGAGRGSAAAAVRPRHGRDGHASGPRQRRLGPGRVAELSADAQPAARLRRTGRAGGGTGPCGRDREMVRRPRGRTGSRPARCTCTRRRPNTPRRPASRPTRRATRPTRPRTGPSSADGSTCGPTIPNLLACVVPHETTHLVLGDLFADAPLPRWADEGMAVLAEPPARLDRFTRTLHSNRRQGRLVPLGQAVWQGRIPGCRH